MNPGIEPALSSCAVRYCAADKLLRSECRAREVPRSAEERRGRRKREQRRLAGGRGARGRREEDRAESARDPRDATALWDGDRNLTKDREIKRNKPQQPYDLYQESIFFVFDFALGGGGEALARIAFRKRIRQLCLLWHSRL